MKLIFISILLHLATAKWLPAFVHEAGKVVSDEAHAMFDKREAIVKAVKEFNDIDMSSGEKNLVRFLQGYIQRYIYTYIYIPNKVKIDYCLSKYGWNGWVYACINDHAWKDISKIAGVNMHRLTNEILDFHKKDINAFAKPFENKWRNEIWNDPDTVDQVIREFMKDPLSTVSVQVMRQSYAMVNVDQTGGVCLADVETSIMASYLMLFCPHEKVYLNQQIMASLRGDASQTSLSPENVRTWGQTLNSSDQYCSNFFAQASSYNWLVVKEKAKEIVAELDTNGDGEFGEYDEFEVTTKRPSYNECEMGIPMETSKRADKEYCFLQAANRSDVRVLEMLYAVDKSLIDSKVDQSNTESVASDWDRDSDALHLASAYGSEDLVKKLVIDMGMSVVSQEKYGRTACLNAAVKGKLESMKFLNSISPSSCKLNDDNGYSALHLNSLRGNIQTARWLVEEFNMDPVSRTKYGRNACHLTAFYGNLETLKYINSISPSACKAVDDFNYSILKIAQWNPYGVQNQAVIDWCIKELGMQ